MVQFSSDFSPGGGERGPGFCYSNEAEGATRSVEEKDSSSPSEPQEKEEEEDGPHNRAWLECQIKHGPVLATPPYLATPPGFLAAAYLSVSKSDGAALTVKGLVRVKNLKNLNPAVSH